MYSLEEKKIKSCLLNMRNLSGEMTYTLMGRAHFENNILRFLVHTKKTSLFSKVCNFYDKLIKCVDDVSPNIGCTSVLFYFYKMNNISLSKSLINDLTMFYECSPRTIVKN